ncbi:hypothetical protein [Arthrobacter sp.]|uniref:hypothetical protein n=1 Tax=Arthrobacter sp. TaxID=1667 RepID=UPI002810D69D|nr:hypothetical protein [Arthrobacter sp.]
MRPEEAIALVFAMALMWVGTILVLLSGLPGRRARRQERKAERTAERTAHQRSHQVSRGRRLAHRRSLSRIGRARIP